MLYTIKTGKCEKFERYFALEECKKQPEEHMLTHAKCRMIPGLGWERGWVTME